MFPLVSLSSCLRRLSAALLLFAAAGGAHAQIAHVNYAQSLVGNFAAPKAVAADRNGNVYVGDYNSGSGVSNLYKETLSGGTYTGTIIASGSYQILNLAVDGAGNVYYNVNSASNSIYKLTLSGSTYTQSVVASGLSALGLGADASGNIFYTDFSASSVVEEKLSGGTYTASTIATGFSYPLSLALDAAGDVFVADNNRRVVRLSPSAGSYTQTTVASGLGSYISIAADQAGDVFVNDYNNSVILEETYSAGAYSSSTAFNLTTQGFGIATDSLGDVFFIGSSNVYKETPLEGADVPALTFSAVNLQTAAPPMAATFTFDVGGTLASPAFSVLTQGDPTLDYQPAATQAANVCIPGHTYAAGDTCTVAVTFTPRQPGVRYGAVRLLGSDGSTIAVAYLQGGGTGPLLGLPVVSGGELNNTYSAVFGFAPDGGGNLYVNNASTIYKVRIADGAILQTFNSFSVLSGVALDGAGNLLITDVQGNKAYLLPVNATYDTPVTLATGLSSPAGIAADGKGNVFIVDQGHSRVLKETFVDESYVQSVIGSGMLRPEAVAVDSRGDVFISDTGNNRVLVETPAANGTYTQTNFPTTVLQPSGIAVDALDNLFLGDNGNHRILKETLANSAYTESVYVSGITPSNDIGYLAVDGNGNLFAEISSASGSSLIKYSVQTPATLDYQTTAVGSTSTDSPKIVVLSNLGNAPLTFAVPATGVNPVIAPGYQLSASGTCPQLSPTSVPVTLAPNATCTDVISFVPVTAGLATGTLVETDNSLFVANSSQVTANFYSVGTGGGTPQASLTPTAVFGSVQIGGAPATQTVTLTNGGTAALPITSASVTTGGSQFTVASTTCTSSLAAGASCTYTLSFTPTATGAQGGTFSVTDSVGTQTSALSGTGLSAGALTIAPTVQAFPATTVGTASTALSSAISNSTAQAVYLSAGALTDANDFTQSDNCNGLIGSGKTCIVTFTFTPRSVASLGSTYSIRDLNNSANPLTVALSGTGGAAPAAQAALTPDTYNFGAVSVGSASPAQTFTLTNAGNAALTIASANIRGNNAGSFSLAANTCPSSLAAGAACTLQVTFKPTASGTFSALVSVADAVGTQSSTLFGTALTTTAPDFTLTATPAAQSSYRGQSVTYSVQLASLLAGNPYNSAVTLTASNLPAGATASFYPVSVTPGTAPASSALTIVIPAVSGAATPGPLRWTRFTPVFAALLGLGLFSKRRWRPANSLFLLFFLAALLTTISGCGGYGSGFAVPTSTSVITITGTGPTATRTTTVTLTLQ